MDIFERLAAPFPPSKVSWRVGKVTKDGKKAMALAYLDARDVMQRLDEVLTPAGWQRRYTHADKKTICELGALLPAPDYKETGNFQWVWKADGAGDSDIEAEKGAISDAFKRAAVNFGIGRYLYDVDSPWVQINEYKQIEQFEYARLAKILGGDSKPIPQRPELSDEQKAATALQHANIHAEAVKGYDAKEYAEANADIITRISKYPEARKVLVDAGLLGE